MTDREKIELMLAHAQAASDLSDALVEQLKGMNLDVAMESLVFIRHRHDQVAGLISQLLPANISNSCSSLISRD